MSDPGALFHGPDPSAGLLVVWLNGPTATGAADPVPVAAASDGSTTCLACDDTDPVSVILADVPLAPLGFCND